MKQKTANEIILQAKRMFKELRPGKDSRKIHLIAEICRKYLHNIARYYGMRYGTKTWQKIGNNEINYEIYSKH